MVVGGDSPPVPLPVFHPVPVSSLLLLTASPFQILSVSMPKSPPNPSPSKSDVQGGRKRGKGAKGGGKGVRQGVGARQVSNVSPGRQGARHEDRE